MKINKLNYFAEYGKVGQEHLDEAMIKAHTMLDRLTNAGADWSKVNGNASFSKIAENQFESLELVLQEIKPGNAPAKSKTEAPSKPLPEKRPAVKTKTERDNSPATQKKASATTPAQQAVKNIRKLTPKSRFGSPVETIDPHLVMLNRYRRLHGKTVAKEKVIALARALVKQIEARVLRKKSEYATTIDQMKEQLFHLIQKSKGAQIAISIPEKTLNAIEKAVSSEHKMKSVQLLNRYAGMAGRITTIEKAKKLYNSIYASVANESIPENDRYFERVIEVMKNLKQYVEDEDERASLALLPAELSGILGCGCKPESDELNGLEYTDYPDDEHDFPLETKSRGSRGPIPSTEFMKRKFNRYYIDEPWVRVFGHIEPGKHTIVFSKEKLGKTTTLVEFAGYLSTHHGPVLFIQKEEELSGTFQDKFEQTQAANPNLYVDEDLPANLDDLRDYKFVFLDSVSRLGLSPNQLTVLQKRLAPHTTLFAILHATKDGQHRGANDYVHDAAHIVEFPEFGVAFGRGRFKGHTGELVRFAEPR